MTQDIDVEWGDDHGGTRAWTVFEIDPADGNNMNRDGPVDNIETYAVIVIDAPSAMTSIMSPSHDDHAHIWINGEKWYNNSRWTGPAGTILHNVETNCKKAGTSSCTDAANPEVPHTSTSTLTTQRTTLSQSTRKMQPIRIVSLMKLCR